MKRVLADDEATQSLGAELARGIATGIVAGIIYLKGE